MRQGACARPRDDLVRTRARIRNPLVASLAFSGLVFAFAASTAAARALRTESASVGLIATLALIVLPFAIWLWASLRLPRGDLGWQELLPGVVLVAVGVQAMHIFTTLCLGPKLTHATELYEHGDDAVRAEVESVGAGGPGRRSRERIPAQAV